MTTQSKEDTEMTEFPVCPHCGCIEDDLSDTDMEHDGAKVILSCGSCGEDYETMLEVSYFFTTRPVPATPTEGSDGK